MFTLTFNFDLFIDDDTKTLMDCDVVKDCHLFVWDGIMVSVLSLLSSHLSLLQVNGDVVPVGKENEPVYLHINYPGPEGMAEVSSGFSKDMTLLELKVRHFYYVVFYSFAEISWFYS